ncbi:MAG: hypothetical protein HUU37_08090 [Bdellovibrionales bacterium]|nr:hypothetical protein [Bdellovibrionales bacterium]
MGNRVEITKGSVWIYRVFDIAEEINVAAVEGLLRNSLGPDKFHVRKFIDRGIVMKKAPMSFGLGDVHFPLKHRGVKADVLVKVREYGVLSFIYRIPIEPGTAWPELVNMAAELEELAEIDEIALRHCQDVKKAILPALKQPTDWRTFEDYTVYFVEELKGASTTKELLERADVPALVLAEPETVMAESTRQSVLENVYQYAENDCAVLEWNAALVWDSKGGREVLDILEFAVTHLLEMRYYDDLLDRNLEGLYDKIERRKGQRLRGDFDTIYRESSRRYIEFTEFIERVENSLKVVGDFYLATVYRAATREFRLSDWQQSITRKMNILAQVSSLLQGEVNIRRSHWLEIIIIALIAFEILGALL